MPILNHFISNNIPKLSFAFVLLQCVDGNGLNEDITLSIIVQCIRTGQLHHFAKSNCEACSML